MASVGKRALVVKRRKTAAENVQSVPSAGKFATGSKRGKLPTGVKRGTIEVNMQSAERAGKLTTSVKRDTVKYAICVLPSVLGFDPD